MITPYERNYIEKAISDELEAIVMYEELASKSVNPIVSSVLRHVANEEKKHVWMFTYILRLLDPEFDNAKDLALKEDLDVLARTGYCSYDGKEGLLRCDVEGIPFELRL